MDQAALVMDEIAAGKEFLKQLDAYQPVKAACWLRSDEGGGRYLYVALDGLTEEKKDAAYGEVGRIARAMTDHDIDYFRVRLIGTTDPIAKAVMDIYRRFPGRNPTRFAGSALGNIPLAEVYIYPPVPAHT